MKLRINSKMVAGYLVMAGLIIVGGLITILYTYQLQRVTSKLLEENISSFKAAQELEVALFRMRGLTLNYVLDSDSLWMNTLEESKTNFLSWLSEANETARSDQEKEILQEISTLFLSYQGNLQTALDLNKRRQKKEATDLLLEVSRKVFDDIYEHCEAFVSHNENDIYAAEEKIRRTNDIVRAAMYTLGAGGLILGILLGVILSRSVAKPIYELVLKVRGATDGELVERTEVPEGGELEDLDNRVHELINRINTAAVDLEKNRKLLTRADKFASLGKVAAGVAHEIRNPLTAIKILIYSMREELATDDENGKDLAVVLKEVERMERFVQNFLRFARPPEPSYKLVDINEAVHETILLLEPQIRQLTGASLAESYDENLEKIFADADQLKQVVMNLTLNAIDSMSDGGNLTVETRQIENPIDAGDASWMELKFVDSGCGIPKELENILFDPFVSGREDGLGLGLSIAYQIVQQHGGWIDAANNPDGGATFTVTLPNKKG